MLWYLIVPLIKDSQSNQQQTTKTQQRQHNNSSKRTTTQHDNNFTIKTAQEIEMQRILG